MEKEFEVSISLADWNELQMLMWEFHGTLTGVANVMEGEVQKQILHRLVGLNKTLTELQDSATLQLAESKES